MRKTFRGYYRPTNSEFSELWDNCIFSFDANILLNIYRYSLEGRKKFMDILNEASDRIIIPYQAAKEYQNNRLEVIKDQEDAYDKIIRRLQKSFDTNVKELNSFKKHPLINVESIINDLEILYKAIESDLQEKREFHPDLFDKDDLRDKLTEVLNDEKISKPCTPEEIRKILEKCKDRFENKIPPGYKDSSKNENKCGDLILWYQLINIAKNTGSPLIFVTDDKKEDWWWIYAGKTIGPRPELIEEMYNEAGVRFYMYKTDQFMKLALNYFFKKDDPKFMEEVKSVMSKDTNTNNSKELDYKINRIISLRKRLQRYKKEISHDINRIEDRLIEIGNKKQITKHDLNEIGEYLELINIAFEEFEDLNQKLKNNLWSVLSHMSEKWELENKDSIVWINTVSQKELEDLLIKSERDEHMLKQRINRLMNRLHILKADAEGVSII